jgi:hypothetical protein
MLTAIHFDDEPLLATSEIDDAGPDWFLTNEFVAHQAACPKVTPQTKFGLR